VQSAAACTARTGGRVCHRHHRHCRRVGRSGRLVGWYVSETLRGSSVVGYRQNSAGLGAVVSAAALGGALPTLNAQISHRTQASKGGLDTTPINIPIVDGRIAKDKLGRGAESGRRLPASAPLGNRGPRRLFRLIQPGCAHRHPDQHGVPPEISTMNVEARVRALRSC
jgi:hypothetical protein